MDEIVLKPNHGIMYLENREDWYHRAVRSERIFRKGMKEIGADKPTIDEIWDEYEKRAKADKKKLKRHLLETVVNDTIDIVKDSSYITWRRIKLFALHLPTLDSGKKIKNSKIKLKEGPHEEGYGNWTIQFHGIGMGSSQTAKYVCNFEVEASNGQCICVYVKAPFRVSDTLVKKKADGKILGEGVTVEIAERSNGINYNGREFKNPPFCLKRDCRNVKNGPSLLKLLIEAFQGKLNATLYNLWQFRNPRIFILEILFSDFTCNLELYIFRRLRLTIELELPPGHDYLMHRIRGRNGIRWNKVI